MCSKSVFVATETAIATEIVADDRPSTDATEIATAAGIEIATATTTATVPQQPRTTIAATDVGHVLRLCDVVRVHRLRDVGRVRHCRRFVTEIAAIGIATETTDGAAEWIETENATGIEIVATTDEVVTEIEIAIEIEILVVRESATLTRELPNADARVASTKKKKTAVETETESAAEGETGKEIETGATEEIGTRS